MTMTCRTLPLAALAGLLLCGGVAPAVGKGVPSPDDTVIPPRPPNTKLLTQEGLLLRYTVRAQGGTLTLKKAQGGEMAFRLGLPVRIDGHDVACKASPSSTPAAPDTCPDWPANLAVGYTRVRVGYWETALPHTDKPVQVIAEITSLGTSAALPGTTRVNVR